MNSVPSDFWSWINHFDSETLAGLMAGVLVLCGVIIGMICLTIYKVHKSRADHALKRELLDRGMSADEIATIIRAAPPAAPVYLPKGWSKD